MRVLVTGGAGFIGSHLVDRLLAEGYEVVVLDNFSSGRRENLRDALASPHLKLVEQDVADPDGVRRCMDGVERVFHLAALADIVPSVNRPLVYHRSNVDGTVCVLEAARAAGVRRFVYAASSSCYGIPDLHPTSEEAPPRPQYPYALTKLVGEQYVLHWGRLYGLPVVSLRLFNVYGPRSRTTGTYGAVFGIFLAQKLAGKPFTVVGDGTQSRDFTYVSDVVDAMVQAAESALSGEILNVGSGRPQTVNRLVELLGGGVVHVPKRPGEPDRTHAGISRIRRLLGWEPRISLEEGVVVMLRHIEDWREAPVWTPEKIEDATRDWFRYLGK
ncbi:MAG: SDR family oxidoreductase [Nitrospirae bacterium]|nr:SDR family oxidoreductase [Nitrospirota bacterium]